MSATVFFKLLAIIVVVALGWVAGKMNWLSHGMGRMAGDGAEPVLSRQGGE